jgi:hypothetical protein
MSISLLSLSPSSNYYLFFTMMRGVAGGRARQQWSMNFFKTALLLLLQVFFREKKFLRL